MVYIKLIQEKAKALRISSLPLQIIISAKIYYFIILALLFCLFIYMFYRTEKTVINEIFVSLVPFEKFMELRRSITNTLPLNGNIIYSLPEGLWVFCITLTSKSLFFKIDSNEIKLISVPLIFSISLEFFQLLNFTQGQFDIWDIGYSIIFWSIANNFVCNEFKRQNILKPFTFKSFICLLSYLIVYLAHVWK